MKLEPSPGGESDIVSELAELLLSQAALTAASASDCWVLRDSLAPTMLSLGIPPALYGRWLWRLIEKAARQPDHGELNKESGLIEHPISAAFHLLGLGVYPKDDATPLAGIGKSFRQITTHDVNGRIIRDVKGVLPFRSISLRKEIASYVGGYGSNRGAFKSASSPSAQKVARALLDEIRKLVDTAELGELSIGIAGEVASKQPVESYVENGWLHRTQMIDQLSSVISALARAGGGVGLLWGQYGMGKRSLVEEVAAALGLRSSTVVLDLSTETARNDGIRRALQADGVDTSSLVFPEQLESMFSARAGAWQDVHLLVLADAANSNEIESLFATAPNIPVVVTASGRILNDPQGAMSIAEERCVQVPPLRATEVDRLLSDAMSEHTLNARLTELARRTPGHLLTVLQMAQFLRTVKGSGLDAFLDDLVRQPDEVVERLATLHGVPNLLVELCRYRLGEISEINLGSHLFCLALWGCGPSRALPLQLAREFLDFVQERTVSELEFQTALAKLLRLGVIQNEEPVPGVPGIAVIDSAFSILFELTAPTGALILQAWDAFALRRVIARLEDPQLLETSSFDRYLNHHAGMIAVHTLIASPRFEAMISGTYSRRVVVVAMQRAPWIGLILQRAGKRGHRSAVKVIFAQIARGRELYVRDSKSGNWNVSGNPSAFGFVSDGLALSIAIWNLFQGESSIEKSIARLQELKDAPLPAGRFPLRANDADAFLL